MNLQLLFNREPEGVVSMDVNGRLVEFIPILKVKELLSNEFHSWSTSNFKWEYIMRGNEFYIAGSVSLNIEIVENINDKITTHYWSYEGTATINILNPNPTMEVNENHTACVLSACIKNAAKCLGKTFGMYLNTPESYCPNYETTQEKQKDNTTKKAITNILNSQSKKTN